MENPVGKGLVLKGRLRRECRRMMPIIESKWIVLEGIRKGNVLVFLVLMKSI
jgi:hypothetical protein